MRTQPTTTQRASYLRRFLFLLVLAIVSPASLVCAQTPASKNPERSITPESFNALMSAVNQQQEQIKRQQKEIEILKKGGTVGLAGDDGASDGAGVVVGSGTPVKHILLVNKSLTLSPKNVGNGMGEAEFALPGAKLGDLVLVTTPDVPTTKSPSLLRGTVTSANKVNVQIWNTLPGPPPGTSSNNPYSNQIAQAPPLSFRVIVIGF